MLYILKLGIISAFFLQSTSAHLPEKQTTFVEANYSAPITYLLFTRQNPTEHQELRLNDTESVLASNFDPARPTKFYGPGWNNVGVIAFSTRDEYLLRDDCNFIIVYWVDIQEQNINNHVLQTTLIAGYHAGAFIDFLVELGAPIDSFHLIGHSAGTHLVGVAGSSLTSGRIPRITGLDPAAGAWTYNNTDDRLDITDAEFVDIMHTNGGRVIDGEVAFDEPIGHVDFYVNGGSKQPGCSSPEFACCSHCRAVDLFAESINSPNGFVSLKCDSWEDYQAGLCDGNEKQLMGDPVSLSARGVFHVATNSEPPYAMG